MAYSVNNVTILGNLGADPETRAIPSGATVCRIRVATTESWKDKNGEWQESTEWHTINLWDSMAERAQNVLKKGSKVYIEGKLKTSTYEKDGEKRYYTEIQARKMIPLDAREKTDTFKDSESDYLQHAPGKDNQADAADDDIPF